MVLETLLERNESYEGASFSLALIAEALGDDIAAEAAYRDTIRKRSAFVPAYLNLAALLERLDRAEDALEILRSVLELDLDEEQSRTIEDAIAALKPG